MVQDRKSEHNIKHKTKRLGEQQVNIFNMVPKNNCVCVCVKSFVYSHLKKNHFRSQLCRSKLHNGPISWHARCAVMVSTSRPDIPSVWDVLTPCANHVCQIYPKNNAHLIKWVWNYIFIINNIFGLQILFHEPFNLIYHKIFKYHC